LIALNLSVIQIAIFFSIIYNDDVATEDIGSYKTVNKILLKERVMFMKLTDKVEAVETKEEKKAIIAEAGMEFTDDELESVAGGIRRRDEKLAQPSGKLPQPNGRLPR